MTTFIFISLLGMPLAWAAKTPCESSLEKECKIGEGGWKQVAEQKYDAQSDLITIWEKGGQRNICIEPGPASCGDYGGDLEAFKKDAERETKIRAKNSRESKAKEARAAEFEALKWKGHGVELLKNGYVQIERCEDGHQWSYVLKKGNDYKLCKGINALGGPSEAPCEPFRGDLTRFRENSKKQKRNCWQGFGQDR